MVGPGAHEAQCVHSAETEDAVWSRRFDEASLTLFHGLCTLSGAPSLQPARTRDAYMEALQRAAPQRSAREIFSAVCACARLASCAGDNGRPASTAWEDAGGAPTTTAGAAAARVQLKVAAMHQYASVRPSFTLKHALLRAVASGVDAARGRDSPPACSIAAKCAAHACMHVPSPWLFLAMQSTKPRLRPPTTC